MRLILKCAATASTLLLSACVTKGTNPADPYEPINREIHKFNMAFDATMLKPPAKFYKAVVPAPIRKGINNAYNNVDMIPTVANDLLQADFNQAIKDTGRFCINTTLGIAGIFDVAAKFNMPPHYNDLGLTFAKWGDKHSPYLVIPFLGPSTYRDGMGMMFDYALFTPYPYIRSDKVLYPLLALRYLDLRTQMLETEQIIDESMDKYTFIRDAYLQRRNFLITGEQAEDSGSLYVDDEGAADYIDEEETANTPQLTKADTKVTPKTSLAKTDHVAHRSPSA